MKSLLVVTVFLFSAYTFATGPSEEFMSVSEQEKEMELISKNIRKKYWRSGHEDVNSYSNFVSKAKLEEHLDPSNRYESDLYDDEVAQLYTCNFSKSCELYLVSVSGSYWGGYGESAHFILLYTKSGKHFEISHTVYAE